MRPPFVAGVFFSLAASLPTASLATALDAATLQKIDGIFSRFTQTTPGCALGISQNGTMTTRAWGMADLERDVPNAPGTIFESGSAAKQITAAAVLLLVREGKLSLDDPVRKHIPELPDYGAPLTLRHALQHTAGLRDWGNLVAVEGWPRGERNYTNAHTVALLAQQRSLNFAPGTNWSYSNSGYILAAEIVARVSGKSLAQFSMERLFVPLKMKNTRWRDDHTAVVKGRALAYANVRDGYRTAMPNENNHGAGGMLTTVEDFLIWTDAINRPGFFDAEFLRTMHEPAKLAGGSTYPYSLGLQHRVWRGVKEVHHGGATAGYRTEVAAFPDQQLHLAVLCNATNANAGTALHNVAALLLGDVLQRAEQPKSAHTLTDAERAAFVGLYRDPRAIGARRIVTDDKSPSGLRVQDGPPLLALDASTLTTAEGLRFARTAKGVTVTNVSGPPQQWDKVAPATPDAAALKEYEGRYASDEVRAEFNVKVVDGKLMLVQPPRTNVRLNPVSADLFESPVAGIAFLRNGSGKVTGLAVGGDRMWRLEMRRME
ncbi:MAG: serine hydrolase [Betaproteobacteria bacterium]|nr:serine hydrolase [Betaproteobacteria bacterium]